MVRMRENTFAGNVGAAIVEAVLTCRFSHWDKGRIQLERVQGPGWSEIAHVQSAAFIYIVIMDRFDK